VSGSGFRVPGSGFRVPGSGFRVPRSGFRVSGFRVSGFGSRVSGRYRDGLDVDVEEPRHLDHLCRFESLILSHHSRYKVTCECSEEDINDDDDDDHLCCGCRVWVLG